MPGGEKSAPQAAGGAEGEVRRWRQGEAGTEAAAGSSEDAGVGSGRKAGRRWWASAADGGEEKAGLGWAAGGREAATMRGAAARWDGEGRPVQDRHVREDSGRLW